MLTGISLYVTAISQYILSVMVPRLINYMFRIIKSKLRNKNKK
jgi:hypothetical protein